MTDREKVVRTYECCKNSFDRICEKCPYEKDCCHDGIPMFVIKKMVDLLKEQDAVEPYSMNAERTYGICPQCGKIIFRYGNIDENRYCGVCGKAVKWE